MTEKERKTLIPAILITILIFVLIITGLTFRDWGQLLIILLAIGGLCLGAFCIFGCIWMMLSDDGESYD